MAENNKNSQRWVGASLPRKEENRLLRGRGKFSDDIKLREMLYYASCVLPMRTLEL